MTYENLTKRSDVSDMTFQAYYSIPNRPVIAVQLTEADAVEHPFASSGSFKGEAGSWRITFGTRPDGSLDVAICQDDIFRFSYQKLANGKYQKRTDIVTEASRLDSAMDIVTIEGPSHGKPGDWLLVGSDGDLHFCDNETFTGRYVVKSDPSGLS